MSFNPVFKGQKILETKNFIVEQDWEVPIPGFYVIAPKKSRISITDFNTSQLNELMKITKAVRNGQRDILRISEVYLFQGEGSRFGFHLWMFPRYDWMKDQENKGDNPNLMIPVMRYAKKNMMTDDIIKKVKSDVRKMRKYLKENF